MFWLELLQPLTLRNKQIADVQFLHINKYQTGSICWHQQFIYVESLPVINQTVRTSLLTMTDDTEI